MVRATVKRWGFAASLLLLAAFAAGIAADLVHTDDGCQVEVHCLACQRVLVSVGIAIVAPQWSPPIEVVGRVAVIDHIAAHEPNSRTVGSRAPPLG
jgi:hypothetical protein